MTTPPAPLVDRSARRRLAADPRVQAFLLLRTAFTVAPIVVRPGQVRERAHRLAGVPGARGSTTSSRGRRSRRCTRSASSRSWPASWSPSLPRFGGWLVAAWLAGIIVNLLTIPGFYDIALRDFGLLVGAVALARLAVAVRPGSQPPGRRRDRSRGRQPAPQDRPGALRERAQPGRGRRPGRRAAPWPSCSGRWAGTRRRRTWPRPRAGSPTPSPRLLTGPPFDLTTFPNDEGYNELVAGHGTSRCSRCASTTCCRSPASRTSATCPATASSACPSSPACSTCSPATSQVQERLTQQVADWLQEQPGPARRRRGDRGRAPVHVAARRAGPRGPHDDIRPARASCGRTLAPRQEFFALSGLRGRPQDDQPGTVRDRRWRAGRRQGGRDAARRRASTGPSSSWREEPRCPTSGRRCPRTTCSARPTGRARGCTPPSWYAENDVELRTGVRATAARPGARTG